MHGSRSPRNLSDALDRLEKMTNVKGADVKEALHDEIENLKKMIEDMKPMMHEFKDKAREQVKDAGQKIDDKVRENPWMSIGIVAFVAFLIGILLGRRD